MSELYLIAHIAGTKVAIKSDNLESVVKVPDIVNVPKSDPAVTGVFALRSRVLTLIDSQYRITGEIRDFEEGSLAIIMEISGHHYGLLVDHVMDVVSISDDMIENNIKSSDEWSNLATAVADVDGEIALIIDHEKIVAQPMNIAA